MRLRLTVLVQCMHMGCQWEVHQSERHSNVREKIPGFCRREIRDSILIRESL
jgi:hypothetical protein